MRDLGSDDFGGQVSGCVGTVGWAAGIARGKSLREGRTVECSG